jgi:hypothetical protein
LSRSVNKRKFGLNRALRSSLVMLPVLITIIALGIALWLSGFTGIGFWGTATFMFTADWILVVAEFFIEIAYYTQRYKAYLKLNGGMLILATVSGIVWSIMKGVTWYYGFIVFMVALDALIFLRIKLTYHKYT